MSAPVAPARSSSVFRVDVTVLELKNVPEQHTSVRVKVSRGETIQLTRVLCGRNASGTVVFSEKLSLLATLQHVDGDACFASKVRRGSDDSGPVGTAHLLLTRTPLFPSPCPSCSWSRRRRCRTRHLTRLRL